MLQLLYLRTRYLTTSDFTQNYVTACRIFHKLNEVKVVLNFLDLQSLELFCTADSYIMFSPLAVFDLLFEISLPDRNGLTLSDRLLDPLRGYLTKR
jgi:hypothetical protein